MKIYVRNDNPTGLSSSVLAEISSAVQQRSLGEVKTEVRALPDAKGELVTALIISVVTSIASSAIYDLIKAFVAKASDAAKVRGENPPKITTEEVDDEPRKN